MRKRSTAARPLLRAPRARHRSDGAARARANAAWSRLRRNDGAGARPRSQRQQEPKSAPEAIVAGPRRGRAHSRRGAALRARARRAGCGFSAVPLRAPTRHTYVPPQPRAGPLRLPMTIAPKLGTANGHCPASLSPPSQRPLSGPPRCSGQTGPSSGHRRRVGAGRARARDVSKGCP